jgi:hypothetical protein
MRVEGVMTKVRLALLGCLLLGATASVPAGGWAVTTIENLPDYVVAGAPWRMRLAVRQHGAAPTSGLTVVVTAAKEDKARVGALNAGEQVSVTAKPGALAGRYEADLAFPSAGNWTITIQTGWAPASIDMPVLAPGQPEPAFSETERGARQFVASGCVSCHRHDAVAWSGQSVDVGPALTDRRYPAEFLSAWIQNPVCVAGRPCMPKLDLSPREIGALTAFLNRPPAKVAAR